MDQLITRTRVLPPRYRPDLLSRSRLLDVFEQLLSYKLILVIAPAGYGKTFALVDLVHNSKWPACWYSVSAIDHDTQRFLAHFIACISQQFPEFGQESNAALLSFVAGHSDIDQLVITVVNELYTYVQDQFILVIDDYHLIDDNPAAASFVSQFVQQVDENCHLILSSRKLLNLPELALMVARGYVGGIDFEDLSFQSNEIQTLVLQNYNISLNSVVADELVTATEGWITGMLLSAETQQWQMASRIRLMRASGVDLYKYLMQQVLDQQGPKVRSFLLRTSLFDELDAALCEMVLESNWLPPGESWQSLIDAVLHNNLFVLAVGDQGVRYHHLFQDFLQYCLGEEQPDEEHLISCRLLTVYTQRRQWEQAYAIAQRLDEAQATANFLEQAGIHLLQAGRFTLLARWLDNLSGAVLSARPQLLSLRGCCYTLQGELEQALNLLNRAEDMLRNGNEPRSWAQTMIYRSITLRMSGNYVQAEQDINTALETLAVFEKSHEDILDAQALAYKSKGINLYMMGDIEQGIEWLRRALDVYQVMDDTQNKASVSMEIAMSYSDAGKYTQAMPLLQYALNAWRESHNLMGQANVLNNLGVHYHQHGEYADALDTLQEALSCARRSGSARIEALALASLGDLLFDVDLRHTALELYRQGYTVARRIDERFLVLYLELALAMLAWSNKDWGEAYACLDAAGKLVLDKSSSFEWALYRMSMGGYYLAQGNAQAALEPLQDAFQCFVDSGQAIEAAKAKISLACAAQAAGHDAQATDYLEDALKWIYSLESQYPVVTTANSLKRFLTDLTPRKSDAGSFARFMASIEAFSKSLPRLRRSCRRASANLLADGPRDLPSLRMCALGRAEVLVNGQEVTNSDWKTKAARDLLFCFLAHPEGLSKEQVSMLFWPDSSPDQIKTRFKNSIYRLRSALGQEVIVYDNNIYRFDRSLDYEYDVELFLENVTLGNSATEASAQIKAYRAATQIYGGDYLLDIDSPWAVIERERLYRLYVDSFLSLAGLYFEADQADDALQCCQRILEKDPCLEEAHRITMRIYASLGNRAKVARQYAQCQQALQEELAAPPSPQTVELYASLMQERPGMPM